MFEYLPIAQLTSVKSHPYTNHVQGCDIQYVKLLYLLLVI